LKDFPLDGPDSHLAEILYTHLSLGETWDSIEIHYNSSLFHSIYFSGINNDKEMDIIVPMKSTDILSMERLDVMMDVIGRDLQRNIESVTLAMVGDNCDIVCYRVIEGIIAPCQESRSVKQRKS
jgi:hypothetical protein